MVLFYRNYLYGGGWYTAHYWSLAVEEHFYLLWPAILAAVGMARGARAAVFMTFVAVAWRICDGRFGWVVRLQPLLRDSDHRTDYNIGVLFFGCALAFFWHSAPTRALLQRFVRSYWVILVIVAQILLVRSRIRWHQIEVEMLMALLPLITIANPGGMVSRLLNTRTLRWIGHLSYSLYLWQQLFIPMRFAPKVLGVVQELPLNVILAVASAMFSYYCIEQPCIRFGRSLQSRVPRSLSREFAGATAK